MRRLQAKTVLSILSLTGFTLLGGFTLSTPFQRQCLKRAGQMPELDAFLPSLVCGKKLRAGDPLFSTLTHLGLIHIFVISGAHLVFLRQLLCRFFPHPFVLWVLLFYTLMVGAHPPVLRAWLVLWVLHLSDSPKITHGRLALSVFLTGLLLPDISQAGLSMALSWAAVSTLIWRSQSKNQKFQLAWLYLTLIPLLIGLKIPHPLTILINALIGPVIFLGLLPLSLLAWLFPVLQHCVELLWGCLYLCLTFLTHLVPYPFISGQDVSSAAALTYAAGLQGLLWSAYILRVRKRCSAKVY